MAVNERIVYIVTRGRKIDKELRTLKTYVIVLKNSIAVEPVVIRLSNIALIGKKAISKSNSINISKNLN